MLKQDYLPSAVKSVEESREFIENINDILEFPNILEEQAVFSKKVHIPRGKIK